MRCDHMIHMIQNEYGTEIQLTEVIRVWLRRHDAALQGSVRQCRRRCFQTHRHQHLGAKTAAAACVAVTRLCNDRALIPSAARWS